ncbi:MAG: hypothetical protein LBK60_03335 [Verrucomicrobiales bacterium]|jgi:hypothetical protein|nr:hypothetical protein [Verrucomicrobiales bacterium]
MKPSLIIVALLLTVSLWAQNARLTPATGVSDAPRQITRQIGLFYTNLQNDNIRHAYNELFKGTRQATDAALINDLFRMTEETIARHGNLDTYELIEARAYGTRILDLACLTRHKDKFYRWQFIYQSADGDDWRLNNMAVDDLRAFLPAYPIAQPPPADLQIKMEKFFLAVQNRATAAAFQNITKGSPLEFSTEQIAAFVAKTNLALGNYGGLKHYELFDNRPLGKGMRLLTYLSALEQQSLRWQFVFTVSEAGQWTLLTIRVDDQIVAGIINSN